MDDTEDESVHKPQEKCIEFINALIDQGLMSLSERFEQLKAIQPKMVFLFTIRPNELQ